MEDQRDRRAPEIAEAYLTWEGQPFPKHGLLLDVSAKGARLRLFATRELPVIIQLSVPRLNIATRARVVWRHGDLCGLEFLSLEPHRPC